METITYHLLRRRARASAARLNAEAAPLRLRGRYRVVKAHRGPWRWRVVYDR